MDILYARDLLPRVAPIYDNYFKNLKQNDDDFV